MTASFCRFRRTPACAPTSTDLCRGRTAPMRRSTPAHCAVLPPHVPGVEDAVCVLRRTARGSSDGTARPSAFRAPFLPPSRHDVAACPHPRPHHALVSAQHHAAPHNTHPLPPPLPPPTILWRRRGRQRVRVAQRQEAHRRADPPHHLLPGMRRRVGGGAWVGRTGRLSSQGIRGGRGGGGGGGGADQLGCTCVTLPTSGRVVKRSAKGRASKRANSINPTGGLAGLAPSLPRRSIASCVRVV
jgi:hypothetical protein